MTNDHRLDPTSERRDFFRIEDRIPLSFQVLSSTSLAHKLERYEKGLENEFTITSNLAVISQEMSGALRKIESESPDIARYLKSLDQKIDLLGRAMLLMTKEFSDQSANAVNLSGSGMAFNTPEAVEEGEFVEIKMLLPSFTGLIVYAQVVACELLTAAEQGGKLHQIRVNFHHLRERDRDVLIRHVLQRQSEQLRLQRQQQEG